MTTQPEALRLADRLDLWGDQGDLLEAAAELRRQHDEIEQLKAERDAAVKAITKHNNECQSLCGNGDAEASACGYRSYFEATGRRCPDCPTYHKIDWPQGAAIDAARGAT